MINCKEASALAAKNEEGKLNFGCRLKLRFHIMMCKVCQLVQKQNKFVITHIKKQEEVASNDTATYHLTQEDKANINNKFQ